MATTPRNIRFEDDLYSRLKSITKQPATISWHIHEAVRKYLEGYAPLNADSVKPKPKKASVKRFVKPTFLELSTYFQDKGSLTCNDDAQRFIDHYESNGWKVGKNPMKDWKAAVRNWMRGKTNERSKQSVKQSPAERAAEQARAIWAECEAEEANQYVMDSHDPALPPQMGGERGGDDEGQLILGELSIMVPKD